MLARDRLIIQRLPSLSLYVSILNVDRSFLLHACRDEKFCKKKQHRALNLFGKNNLGTKFSKNIKITSTNSFVIFVRLIN